MALIVQKFGGSSVADTSRIRNVAARVAQTVRNGHKVVVVVSAMGDTTDDLLALAATLLPSPLSDDVSLLSSRLGGVGGGLYPPAIPTEMARSSIKRDLDLLLSTGETITAALLAMTLTAQGVAARAFTGAQAGIRTDGVFGGAEIIGFDIAPLHAALGAGIVSIVTGYQGAGSDGEVTTLGRGGSDTSAVALATLLHADWCEIYTDVDGVYTADPRLVPHARKLDRISYSEMLELAAYGANVLHPRAVSWGLKGNLPIIVRSSFNHQPGTIIGPRHVRLPLVEASAVEWPSRVRGLALQSLDKQRSRVSLVGEGVGENVRLDQQMRVALRKAGFDFRPEDHTHLRLSYVLAQSDAAAALRLLHAAARLDAAMLAGHSRRPNTLPHNVPYIGIGAVTW